MKKEAKGIVLSDKEMHQIIDRIARKTYGKFLKLVADELLIHKDLPLDTFLSIFFMSIGTVDGNLVRWAASMYESVTQLPAPYEKMKEHFLYVVKDGLDTKIGNH